MTPLERIVDGWIWRASKVGMTAEEAVEELTAIRNQSESVTDFLLLLQDRVLTVKDWRREAFAAGWEEEIFG